MFCAYFEPLAKPLKIASHYFERSRGDVQNSRGQRLRCLGRVSLLFEENEANNIGIVSVYDTT